MTAEAAYEHCRQIARASRSSFYAGMRLLAPDRRAALFAVYALARRIDDVADGDLPDDAKLAALAQLRGELAHVEDSEEPVLVAVPHPHAPVIAGAGLQRRTGVVDEHGGIRRDAAGIPQQVAAGGEPGEVG